MNWIDAAGISLSVLAILILVWMIADARRLEASSYQRPVDTRWSTLRTPFYLAVRKEERSARGAWQVEARDASLQLPWTFLLGCLAYLFFRRARMRSRDGFSRATRTGGRLSTG
jgi:hypothetical protein